MADLAIKASLHLINAHSVVCILDDITFIIRTKQLWDLHSDEEILLRIQADNGMFNTRHPHLGEKNETNDPKASEPLINILVSNSDRQLNFSGGCWNMFCARTSLVRIFNCASLRLRQGRASDISTSVRDNIRDTERRDEREIKPRMSDKWTDNTRDNDGWMLFFQC